MALYSILRRRSWGPGDGSPPILTSSPTLATSPILGRVPGHLTSPEGNAGPGTGGTGCAGLFSLREVLTSLFVKEIQSKTL